MLRDITIPLAAVQEVCRRYRVAELAVFGSALREDFRPESDIDLLVTFESGARIGLLEFAGLQEELANALQRRVDLVSKRGLKPSVRDQVLADAQVLYAA